MNALRHGCRVFLSIAFVISIGCGGSTSPKLMAIPKTRSPLASQASSTALHLAPPQGLPVAVAQIAWGGALAPGILAVRYADGRFAAFRLDRGQIVRISGGTGGPSMRALCVVGPDRLVTGGSDGLSLWKIGTEVAERASRVESGAVTSLGLDESDPRRMAFAAGFADGTVRRYGIGREDRLDETSRAIVVTKKASILGLGLSTSRGSLTAVASDGTAWTIPASASASCVSLGHARALATSLSGTLTARLGDGPLVEVLSGTKTARFYPPAESNSIAWVEGERVVAIGSFGKLFLVPVSPGPRIQTNEVRAVAGYSGPVVISSDRDGSTLAIGDGSGKLDLLPAQGLIASGTPISLDDAPDLAFQPWARLGRPRSPAKTDSSSRGESLAKAAETQCGDGEATPEVLRLLVEASTAFASEKVMDREADMEFWRGLLLCRRLDPRSTGRDARTSPDAMTALRRAASLYHVAGMTRQAALAEAGVAWAAISMGDERHAIESLARSSKIASADPVLSRVPELDRIAAVIFGYESDWTRSAEADARVIERLAPGEKSGLRREAGLSLAASLANRGAWSSAASALEAEARADHEWTIRRAICRSLAGLADDGPTEPADDPIVLRLSATLQKNPGGEKSLADLKQAAANFRAAGHSDLAIEADLARAEALERSGRNSEAGPIYFAVERDIRMIGPDPARKASRPILDAAPRAARGLARIEIASRRFGHAFAAIERAGSKGVEPESGGLLGLPAADLPLALSLSEAKRAAIGPDESASIAANAKIQKLKTDLANHARAARPRDDPAGPDPSSLGLNDDEALLEIAAIGPESIAGILYRGRSEPVALVLQMRKSNLARAIGEWRSGLGDGGRPVVPDRPAEATAFLGIGPEPDAAPTATSGRMTGLSEARVLDGLFAPFDARLSGVTRLFVVPGAGLISMPLESLGHGTRLSEKFALRLNPSATMLPSIRDEGRPERAPGNRAIVVAADRGSERLASLRAGSFAAEIANPSAAGVPSLSDFAVVHLRIASGDNTITPDELATTPILAKVLVAEIATPSATSIMAWSSAGLKAGADSVLIPLWTHPEVSSRLFFESFYKSLGAGEKPGDALAKARSTVARDPKFRDPVHWAGYALFGR